MKPFTVRDISTGEDQPWGAEQAFAEIAAITDNLRKKHSAIGKLQDDVARVELYAKDEQMRLTDAHEKLERLDDLVTAQGKRLVPLLEMIDTVSGSILRLEQRVGRLFGNQMETEGGLSQRVSNNGLAFDKLSKMVVDLQERLDGIERVRLEDIRRTP